MPPVRRLGKKGANIATRLPIPSLSGGVGRQAPSKRTPFEAENIDNCFVTIERSIEKRSGFEVMSKLNEDTFPLQSVLSESISSYYYYWLNIDKNNRFLIIINYAAKGATQKLFDVYRIVDNYWENLTPLYQWDDTDASLTWDGTTPIDPIDPRYVIWSFVADSNNGTVTLAQYNAQKLLGVVKKESRAYITFGSVLSDTQEKEYTAKEALRIVSLGTNTLILNTLVYAGFSSNEDGYEVDFNGYVTNNIDLKGRKITYYSAVQVVKTNLGRLWPQGTTLPSGETALATWVNKFIPVEDYVYAEVDRAWLGQSLSDFSEIRFPPDENDWYANNGDSVQSDNKAQLMLQALYDKDHPYLTGNYPVQGRGKIYYCAGPYLSQPAGYYRIISFPETETYDPLPADGISPVTGKGRPYTQRVRTPDAFSYIDPNRMPQNLVFTSATGWKMQPIDWSPRTTGNRYTNPGPSPFLSEDKKTLQPARINAISVFRDRLFFAVGDVVFSSQLGNFQDLWINDPTSVTTADPIDLRASLNQYAEIISMTPFDEFLFVNTKGNVQFELKGSQNVISPLTAEISPTTFYATAPLVDPVLIGSQVYFFDSKRLYIYFSQKVRGLNTAVELSATCPDYLPEEFGTVCTAVAQDTILVTDGQQKNNIYVYTNRYSGERILQSAFSRFVLDTNDKVESMQSYDNFLYALIRRDESGVFYLTRCSLKTQDYSIPRLDFYHKFTIPSNTPSGLTQTFTVPYGLPYEDVYVVLGEDFENLAGTTYKATVTNFGNSSQLSITGIDFSDYVGKSYYIGGAFLMNVQLSEQFLRDDQNNSVNGVLNLRTLVTRHANTGHYKVISERRGRTVNLESEFSFVKSDQINETYEKNGEFISKIFGFSDNTKIFIQSNLPSPCNIVQMELKGKFKQTYTSLR
jgi:hypothetical protein